MPATSTNGPRGEERPSASRVAAAAETVGTADRENLDRPPVTNEFIVTRVSIPALMPSTPRTLATIAGHASYRAIVSRRNVRHSSISS